MLSSRTLANRLKLAMALNLDLQNYYVQGPSLQIYIATNRDSSQAFKAATLHKGPPLQLKNQII